MLTPDDLEEIVRNTKAPSRIVRLFCELLKTGAFHISPPGRYTVSDGLAIFEKRQRTAEAARLPIYGIRALLLLLAKLPEEDFPCVYSYVLPKKAFVLFLYERSLSLERQTV
jgi:hypothetical protein